MNKIFIFTLLIFCLGCDSFDTKEGGPVTPDFNVNPNVPDITFSNSFINFPSDPTLKLLKLLPESGLSLYNGTIYKETLSSNTVFISGFVAEGATFIKYNVSTKAVTVLSKKFEDIRENKYIFVGGIIYFIASEDGISDQLWSLTVSNNQFRKLTNFSGLQDGTIYEVFNQGSNVYFYARVNNGGYTGDVWSVNTSTFALTKVTNFVALNPLATNPEFFYVNGNIAYFRVAGIRDSLFEFNLTTQNLSTRVHNTIGTNFGFSKPLGIIGSDFYVVASNSEMGFEIYKLNLMTNVVTITLDYSPGASSTFINSTVFFDNKFILSLRTQSSTTIGTELYSFNPVLNSIDLIEDLYPGVDGSNPNQSQPDEFTVVGDKLYFIARNESLLNRSLFRLQNNVITKFSNEISPGYGYLQSLAGKLYFTYSDSSFLGSFQESNSAFDFNVISSKNINGFADLKEFVRFDETRYFMAARHPVVGESLWSYNSSSNSVRLIAETNTGIEGDLITNLQVFGDYVYYVARGYPNGYELWRYNVVTTDLERITNVNPSILSPNVFDFTIILNNNLYFAVRNSSQTQIFRYSFLDSSISLVSNQFEYTGPFAVAGNNLYFMAPDAINGYELRLLNSSTNQITLVRDHTPGAGSTSMSQLNYHNGSLMFECSCNNLGSELWRLNEVSNTYELILDVYPGTSYSSPKGLVAIDGSLYFTASNSSIRSGAFRYNLATSNISVIANYNLDVSTNFEQRNFIKNGNKILFFKGDTSNDYNIISYDLTSGLLSNEVTFDFQDQSNVFGIFDNRLYFSRRGNGHYLPL